jgi:flagellar biosynthesis/type III secretory pathway protein FliH
MEQFATSMAWLSATAVVAAAQIKLYDFAYRRGYDNGKHQGFTEGLFRAQERMQRNARKALAKPLMRV